MKNCVIDLINLYNYDQQGYKHTNEYESNLSIDFDIPSFYNC